MNFSVTQVSNITALAGAIVLIARVFKFQVSQEDVIAVISACVLIFGIVVSYINRYKKGDINLVGGMKQGEIKG